MIAYNAKGREVVYYLVISRIFEIIYFARTASHTFNSIVVVTLRETTNEIYLFQQIPRFGYYLNKGTTVLVVDKRIIIHAAFQATNHFLSLLHQEKIYAYTSEY